MAGIYIHIPFCKQACTYCNFYFSTKMALMQNTIAAINTEIIMRKNELANQKIHTIYFGGGTPSLASVQNLISIISTIKNNYNLAPNAEITIEVNPDDIGIEVLKAYLNLGINRLSIGIQSFDNTILKLMNRAHNANKAMQCLADIKTAGFTNYSADLIYGNPNQTLQNFQNDVNTLLSFKPTHISAYALTVEPKTVLQNWINNGKIAAPIPQLQSNMYAMLIAILANHGYQHYEISNWALPSFISKHNSSYWHNIRYMGIGPSAHSFNGSTRRWNISNTNKYITGLQTNNPSFNIEYLTPQNIFNEYIMIKLRLQEGINKAQMLATYNNNWCNNAFKILTLAKNNKLITETATHIALTQQGKFFADGLAASCFV